LLENKITPSGKVILEGLKKDSKILISLNDKNIAISDEIIVEAGLENKNIISTLRWVDIPYSNPAGSSMLLESLLNNKITKEECLSGLQKIRRRAPNVL
jgi:hypothetical protein